MDSAVRRLPGVRPRLVLELYVHQHTGKLPVGDFDPVGSPAIGPGTPSTPGPTNLRSTSTSSLMVGDSEAETPVPTDMPTAAPSPSPTARPTIVPNTTPPVESPKYEAETVPPTNLPIAVPSISPPTAIPTDTISSGMGTGTSTDSPTLSPSSAPILIVAHCVSDNDCPEQFYGVDGNCHDHTCEEFYQHHPVSEDHAERSTELKCHEATNQIHVIN